MASKFCQLWLTCASKDEAYKIQNTLLVKQLVACVHQIPIQSSFRWQGKINDNKEVLLVMDTRDDLFDQIEAEVTKLHSYDTFVLTKTAYSGINRKATDWLNEVLL